jgi:hypothetical protein
VHPPDRAVSNRPGRGTLVCAHLANPPRGLGFPLPLRIYSVDVLRPIIDWTGARKAQFIAAMKAHQMNLRVRALINTAKLFNLIISAGLLLAACSHEAKLGNANDATGVYTLVSVNGSKLPATVSHDGAQLQVRAGAFTIAADGTCGSKVVFVPPSGVEATREVKASYTRNGSKLTMHWQGAGMTTGSIENNTFTMDNEGMTFAYRK